MASCASCVKSITSLASKRDTILFYSLFLPAPISSSLSPASNTFLGQNTAKVPPQGKCTSCIDHSTNRVSPLFRYHSTRRDVGCPAIHTLHPAQASTLSPHQRLRRHPSTFDQPCRRLNDHLARLWRNYRNAGAHGRARDHGHF